MRVVPEEDQGCIQRGVSQCPQHPPGYDRNRNGGDDEAVDKKDGSGRLLQAHTLAVLQFGSFRPGSKTAGVVERYAPPDAHGPVVSNDASHHYVDAPSGGPEELGSGKEVVLAGDETKFAHNPKYGLDTWYGKPSKQQILSRTKSHQALMRTCTLQSQMRPKKIVFSKYDSRNKGSYD